MRKPVCNICGEERAVTMYSIVPPYHGGNELENNTIALCKTHLFLFKSGQLSKEEFYKIDTTKFNPKTQIFFDRTRHAAHKMFWKYGTKNMESCRCGSIDFDFVLTHNQWSINPVFKCKQCGEELSIIGTLEWAKDFYFPYASYAEEKKIKNTENLIRIIKDEMLKAFRREKHLYKGFE